MAFGSQFLPSCHSTHFRGRTRTAPGTPRRRVRRTPAGREARAETWRNRRPGIQAPQAEVHRLDAGGRRVFRDLCPWIWPVVA